MYLTASFDILVLCALTNIDSINKLFLKLYLTALTNSINKLIIGSLCIYWLKLKLYLTALRPENDLVLCYCTENRFTV